MRVKTKDLYDEYLITSMVAGFEPVEVDHAYGCVMVGRDGREYLDCFSGIAVVNAGHCHPEVVSAAKVQMDKFIHCGAYVYYSPPVGELARRLAEITRGGLRKSFFGSSGAEAVEGAIRLAKQFTKRKEVVALTHGFHGRTVGALVMAGTL